MPLFKKGNKNIPSNYRPISLKSCTGKMMEAVMFKHIYNHLHVKKLIYETQSGFLPGHSTMNQILGNYHQICYSFDNKIPT
jgi:hypothetical protein